MLFATNYPKPQLADVVGRFSDGEGACSPGCGGVGAGVARVPDVGGVGGDGGPAGGGRDDAADSEACSTVTVRGSSFRGALRAGHAGPEGGGGAGPGALLVGELDDGEEGECL